MSNIQTAFLIAVAICTGVIATARVLDHISTSKTKAWLWETYIARTLPSPDGPHRGILDFLNDFHQQVLVPYFSNEVQSWRFFRSSASLSLPTLLLLFLSVYFANNRFEDGNNYFGSTFSLANLGIAIWLIVGTVVIDYFSFAKTFFFLDLIRSRRSAVSLFIIFVSDLILTTYLFMFLMPFFMGIALIVGSQFPREGEFKVYFYPALESWTDEDYKRRLSGQLPTGEFDAFGLEVPYSLFRGQLFLTYRDSIARYTIPTFVFSSSNVTENNLYYALATRILEGSAKLDGNELRLSSPEERSKEANLMGHYHLAGFARLSTSDFIYSYAAAYREINDLRNGFWAVLRMDPIVVKVASLYSGVLETRFSGTKEHALLTLLCSNPGQKDLITTQFRVDRATLDRCNAWALSTRPIPLVIKSIALGIDERNGSFSVSWMFLSSFALTIIMYVTAFIFIVGAYIVRLSSTFMFQGYLEIDKSLFTVMAIPASIVAAVLGGFCYYLFLSVSS